ncbi:hypothetical protein Q7P35_004185 [Cladosporium inversicolor]
MSKPTDSLEKVSPPSQPEVPKADTSATEGTIVQPSSAPSTNHDNVVPDFFKPGHVVQITLRTFQDVTRARSWIQSIGWQARPILSEFEFSFRALYDGIDGTTSIRVLRHIHRHEPHTNPKTELAA